jgi:hypothetical protein
MAIMLQAFVNARKYRGRAADYLNLAEEAFLENVRTRYIAISQHYVALAEAEERFAKGRMSERFERRAGQPREANPTVDLKDEAQVEPPVAAQPVEAQVEQPAEAQAEPQVEAQAEPQAEPQAA